jgi:Cys-tRNA(Pro)/Cys-tRNA(Cys) deacylase
MGGKTNAMRALDRRKLQYEAREYYPSITSASGVADALGVTPDEVYKTLVMMTGGGEAILVMVPGDHEVDLKVLAHAVGARSVGMAPKAEAERLTGLQTGGIGALALLDRRFGVYIDRDALDREAIFVNGGRRGLNLRVRVRDLIDVTRAVPVQTA